MTTTDSPQAQPQEAPERLIVCTDGHKPAIADWARDKMKTCDVEYVRVSVVLGIIDTARGGLGHASARPTK
jgi:hypothetical protein